MGGASDFDLQPALPVPDANKIRTTVGSDGTLDETGVGKAFLDRGMVQTGRPALNPPTAKKSAALPPQTQSAVMSYNVVPVDGLFTLKQQPCTGGCAAYKLTLRYLAAGSAAGIQIIKIQTDRCPCKRKIQILRLNVIMIRG